jgi:hypothetical protein
MKTLNLNKLTILLGLFLVSAFFTTSANASCVVNGDGAIVTVVGDSQQPVQDDFALGTQSTQCRVTPINYTLKFYKYGICKTDPSLGDLSSCAMLFSEAAGVEYVIRKGVSGVLDVPEFFIEPGVYPYNYLEISNKIGLNVSITLSNPTQGSSGEGTSCWTTTGQTANTSYDSSGSAWTSGVHGAILAYNTVPLDCGSSAIPVNHNVIINKLSTGRCDSAFTANGDRTVQSNPYRDDNKFGLGQGLGVATISLLTTTNGYATDCTDAAKIAWTQTLDTVYTITEDSTFGMLVKATDAAILAFSYGVNNDIASTIAFAPEITLQVTN